MTWMCTIVIAALVAQPLLADVNVHEGQVDPTLIEGTDDHCSSGEDNCHVGLMQIKKQALTAQVDQQGCDWQCYLNRYPDLRRAFGETNTGAAANHYSGHGIGEGRDCTCTGLPTCDFQCYLDRYPDLQNAFGATNVGAAQTHWRSHGQDEGRECTCEIDCCEDPDVTYATCSAWGDPHFTKTFGGPNRFDFQGLGLYRLASSADKSFQVQAFQCKPRPDASVAVYAGFAMQTNGPAESEGSSIVTIIGDTVTVDGQVTTEPPPTMAIDLPYVEVCSSSPCAKFKYHKTAIPSYTLGYESSFHLYMDSTNVGGGICATGHGGVEPVDCVDSLFTTEQLRQLCESCGMENCNTCPTAPAGYVPATTPEQVCENAGLSFSQAETACIPVATEPDYYHACLVDYCASGGDDTVIDSVESAELRDAEELEENVNIVTIPPTSAPTASPTPQPTPAPIPPTSAPTQAPEEAAIYGDPHIAGYEASSERAHS